MENVIRNHPKMIKRWAKIYLDKYIKNKKSAIEWGMKFLPDDAVDLVVEEAKREIAKRGLKIK